MITEDTPYSLTKYIMEVGYQIFHKEINQVDLRNMKLNVRQDYLERVIYDMIQYYVKNKVHTETTTEIKDNIVIPYGWWNAFKSRWIPKRFEVFRTKHIEYRTYELKIINTTNIYHTCPHIALDRQRDHVDFLIQKPVELFGVNNEHI